MNILIIKAIILNKHNNSLPNLQSSHNGLISIIADYQLTEMFVVRSFCLGADSAFAHYALSYLQHTNGFADLAILGLVKRSQATVFTLLPQVAQQLFVFKLVLETKIFAHSLMFGEQKLVGGNILVPLLKSKLEPSKVDNGFFPEFLKVFNVLLRWC